MSRCFPFPPPGYEKKTRTDDIDLLNKDKHKEKKHKKEKKEKKKEGKDKKDNERSKDKDREKKERKEKHRDKKKSKDKKKADEEKIEEQPEGSNGRDNWGKHCENNQEAEAIEEKRSVEIGRRIADEERGRRDQMVENLPACDPRKEDGVDRFGEKYYENRVQEKENIKDKDGHDKKTHRQRFKDEGRVIGNTVVPSFTGAEQRRDQMVEKLPASDPRKEGSVARFVEKHHDNRVLGNTVVPSFTGPEQRRDQMVENLHASDPRKDGMARFGEKPYDNRSEQRRDQMVENLHASDPRKDGVARFGEKPYDNRIHEKENNKDKNGHDTKADRQRFKDEGRVIGNTLVPSFTGLEQRRVGMAGPVEKDAEKKMEGKEKKKDQEGNDKQEIKHKHRDGEKKIKEKKVKEKEKKKEKVKHENRKHDKMIEVPRDPINILNIKPTQIPKDGGASGRPTQIPKDGGASGRPAQIPKDGGASGSTDENLKKRKDCETNGFLHDNDVLPNKLPRSSHPPTVNGRKPELCQPATQFTSAFHSGAKNIMWDDKVLKANGLIPVQPTSISSTSPSVPRVQPRENGEASKKPSHPDSKYLNKILSVPKMDDWSDFDDQEWLFSSDSLQVKKPKTVSSGVDGSPQVWDRALRIDSADVCALPYVIPY